MCATRSGTAGLEVVDATIVRFPQYESLRLTFHVADMKLVPCAYEVPLTRRLNMGLPN
jgi:hypothetical protein